MSSTASSHGFPAAASSPPPAQLTPAKHSDPSISSSSQQRPQQRFVIDNQPAEDSDPPLPSIRYDSPSLHSGPSKRRLDRHRHRGGAHHHHHAHAFPDRADSLRDVAALAKLIDYRSSFFEDHRLSVEDIRQRTEKLGWRKAAAVAAFYERQNEILDGWREVDEILDSRFPDEVMRRLSSHDEHDKKRQRSLDFRAARIRNGRLPGDSTESEEIDDDEYDGDGDGDRNTVQFGQRGSRALKRSFSEKAVTALTGFWFNNGSSNSSNVVSNRTPDLESGEARGRRCAAQGRKKHGTRRRPVIEPGLAEEEEDGYNEDEEEEDDDYEYDDNGEARHLINNQRHRGRKATRKAANGGSSGGNYGLIRSIKRSAVELYDRIREEGRYEELRRFESSVTLPGSLQKTGFAMPRSGSPTARGAATPPVVRQIDQIPEHGGPVPSSTAAAAAAAALPPESVDENDDGGGGCRSRPYSTHSAERQALLDTVPGRDKEEETSRGVQFAININLLVNVLLLGGKGVAVVSSNSVSLIASFVDSALDLLSTIIIFATSKAIAYRSWRTFYKYPVGKKRLEPLGVVIFSVLMVASFCQVFIVSVQRLRLVVSTGEADPDSTASLPLVGIAFMLATIGIKAVMWLLYRSSKSSGVRAVAQDAENDVFFNLLSLTFPLIGSKLRFPALDPLGGIVLSVYIIYEWLHTLVETLQKLSGATAGSEQVSKCIYLITRFNSVNSIAAFELFHAGDECIAEADVVLPQSISLKEAHDLGEIITYCTECLETVERAYVHLDYNARYQTHLGLRG